MKAKIPITAKPSRSRRSGFLADHSLSISIAAVLAFLLVMYWRSDPSTHLGSFYGNAIADWLGTFMFVIATKYCYEIGSRESRRPHPKAHIRLLRFLVKHSLTIVLLVTGGGWIALYARSGVDSKAGQVIGNIVSEWTQLIGLVWMTKFAREAGSKED